MERLTGRNKHGGIISLITGVHADVERVRLIHKLAAYEEAEEQGRLVVLPCKKGDTIWAECWNGYGWATVISVDYNAYNDGVIRVHYLPNESDKSFVRFSDQTKRGIWGETVFLTREEAEAALKADRRKG